MAKTAVRSYYKEENMKKITDIKLVEIPLDKVVSVVTSIPDHKTDKIMFIEPIDSEFIIVRGSQNENMDFNGAKWEAKEYTPDELLLLTEGWIKSGSRLEKQIAPAIRKHLSFH